MLFVRQILLKVIAVTLPAVALVGCQVEPDLEFESLFLDSPLQLTPAVNAIRLSWVPTVNEITLSWDAEVEATAYRVTGPNEIMGSPGEEAIPVDESTVTYTRTYSVPSAPVTSLNGIFLVEASMPDPDGGPDVWVAIAYTISVVEDTEYVIKQTDGPVDLIPGREVALGEVFYVIDAVGVNNVDWLAAAFTVEANNPDPEIGLVNLGFAESFFYAARTLQLTWAAVDTAIEYRLTQTVGRWPLIATPQIYDSTTLNVRFPVPVHLFDWANTRFVLEANTDSDGDGTYDWEFVGEQDTAYQSRNYISQLDEYDPLSPQLRFGWSVAVNEDTARYVAVGAVGEVSVPEDQRTCPDEEPDCDLDEYAFLYLNSGAVYVTDLQPVQLEVYETTQIKAPNVGIGDAFGSSVVLSDDGSILAVAATGEDSSAIGDDTIFDSAQDNDDSLESGAVYVYEFDGTDWQLDAYFKAPNAEAFDVFGWDIDLSGDGNTLVISAYSEDGDGSGQPNNDFENSGAVYVYNKSGGVWNPNPEYLKASNAEESDLFGQTVELSGDGNYLAVSAIGEDGSGVDPSSNGKPDSGAVYVFARDGSDWVQTSYLKSPGAAAGNWFGQSLSLTADGSLLAVGEPKADGGGALLANYGSAWLFERTDAGISSSWQQTGARFTASNPNFIAEFGNSIELSSGGEYLSVGAWGDETAGIGINGSQSSDGFGGSGAVYVFERLPGGGLWEQISYVKAPVRSGGYISPPFFLGKNIAMALKGEFMALSADYGGPEVETYFGYDGYVYLY